MGWVKSVWAGGMALSMLALGCQSKLYEQNKQLMAENQELRAQNERAAAQSPAPQQPIAAAPQPVASQPQAAAPQDVQPAAPANPKSVEQIGGLETTVSRSGNTVVHLPSDIFFDPGQATLRSSAKTSLDKVIVALNDKFAGKKIRVEGHTDSQPIRVSKWASNQELSEARAKAVKDYLAAKGVTASRVTIKGWGDTKPRGSDMSRNRRVEIVVLTAPSAAAQ